MNLRTSGLAVVLLALEAGIAFGQRQVTFSLSDGTGQIRADLYGSGDRAVVLAHGGRFTKESWKKQAEVLAEAGFLVLAIRFRGETVNRDGSPSAEGSGPDNTADVMAAVTYLRHNGAKTVSAVGGSLGGDAVGEANARMPGAIGRIVMLGSSGGDSPERLNGRKLFIVARSDSNGAGPRLPGIAKHYERAPQPKQLIVLEGSAHAQFLFSTDQGPRLMDEILHFLSAP